MQKIEHLAAASRIAMPWKNGGGVTREVARDPRPEAGGAFEWRVSVAEVSAEGPFSRFDGYRRLIAAIGGRGMELRSLGKTVLLEPRRVHAFDGSDEVSGLLPLGPVSDLNVIYRPDVVQASLRFSEGPEHLQVAPAQTILVLNLHAASVVCMSTSLTPMDAILATGGATLVLPEAALYAIIEISAV